MTEPTRQSTLHCPHCDAETSAQMPADACVYFFECPSCRAMLKPKPGDCCVFCSYGSSPCPQKQSS